MLRTRETSEQLIDVVVVALVRAFSKVCTELRLWLSLRHQPVHILHGASTSARSLELGTRTFEKKLALNY